MVLATHVGPILDLRAGLDIKTTLDATFAWLLDWDSGCTVRCTAAIHMSSDHRGMGSVASHLRGSSIHSFVYSYIYIYIYRGSGREASHSDHAPSSSPPAIRSFCAAAIFFASASNPPLLLQLFAPQLD